MLPGSRLLLGTALLSVRAFAGAHVDPGDRPTGISTDGYSGLKQETERRALFGNIIKTHGNSAWTAPTGVSFVARTREAMSEVSSLQPGSGGAPMGLGCSHKTLR